MKSPLPCELRPEHVCIVIDSREQQPYDFPDVRTVVGTLDLFDYSLLGQELRIGVERKSLSDYVSSCAGAREMFERRIMRARSLDSYCLIVEASWHDLQRGEWRSRITPASVTGSTLAWMGEGLPILLAGDRESAQKATARFLFCAARRRYRELRSLLTNAEDPAGVA